MLRSRLPVVTRSGAIRRFAARRENWYNIVGEDVFWR
jgi:hypothetical protein